MLLVNSERMVRIRWFGGGAIAAAIVGCLVGGSGLHSRSEAQPSRSLALAAPGGAPSPTATPTATPPGPPDDGKLRIIVFGAHPDDCEIKAGGVAAKWSALGHHVKFVSLTNGDIGHWAMAGGPLARRRLAEVERCADIFGITTEVVDIHDGELLPTLPNRRTVTRLIRQWKADVVMCHRPNDYHPDHRNVGVLVQDAAYMVTVPFFCPDTPHLERNPVFLYLLDRFHKPNPFTADIAVDIGDVIEKKLAAMAALESQFFEGGCNGSPDLVPDDEAGRRERRRTVRRRFSNRFSAWAVAHRDRLEARYGKERAAKIRFAEAFEICEYGRRPSEEEIRRLFPFFPKG